MKTTKKEVKAHVVKARAKLERKVLQARDEMFRKRDDHRFSINRRRSECRKLMVDGVLVSDDDELRNCWKDHFSELSQSKIPVNVANKNESDLADMEALSHGFEDLILDYPTTSEEIERALKRLKLSKSAGADGLSAEHLKYAGTSP